MAKNVNTQSKVSDDGDHSNNLQLRYVDQRVNKKVHMQFCQRVMEILHEGNLLHQKKTEEM